MGGLRVLSPEEKVGLSLKRLAEPLARPGACSGCLRSSRCPRCKCPTDAEAASSAAPKTTPSTTPTRTPEPEKLQALKIVEPEPETEPEPEPASDPLTGRRAEAAAALWRDELWGDDDDDVRAEAANEERLEAIAEAHRQKLLAEGTFKEVVGMSKVVLDIKPWDDSTDMAELEKLVRAIAHPTNGAAIAWQASQLEDIGYGIKKLRIVVQVVDDDVSVDDDLVEVIAGMEDHVQSCDIFAFNKA